MRPARRERRGLRYRRPMRGRRTRIFGEGGFRQSASAACGLGAMNLPTTIGIGMKIPVVHRMVRPFRSVIMAADLRAHAVQRKKDDHRNSERSATRSMRPEWTADAFYRATSPRHRHHPHGMRFPSLQRWRVSPSCPAHVAAPQSSARARFELDPRRVALAPAHRVSPRDASGSLHAIWTMPPPPWRGLIGPGHPTRTGRESRGRRCEGA